LKKVLFTLLALVLAIGLVVPAAIADTTSPTYTAQWDGKRGGDSLHCDKIGESPERTESGWIHWVFSTKGESTDALLTLGGTGSGSYTPGNPLVANVWHFYTPYFDLSGLTATIELFGGDPGPGGGLVISDYCPGDSGGGPQEALTVTKTAITSYTRTHNWSIDKSVDTDNAYEEGGYPKIWLYTDGSGDESATWTVDVTYGGFEDSDFNVSGEITIENNGDTDAVITDVIDDLELAGTEINVDLADEDGDPVTLPYTLEVGKTLTGTYSEDVDSKINDYNEVTVETEQFEYWNDAEIIWGDPTAEVNDTVEITDTNAGFADKYGDENGQVFLYAGDYEEGDVITFTYTNDFAWEDYGEQGCGDYIYDNTAQVIGDDEIVLDSDDATLLVNVQCYIYETAYAKGGSAICFIPTFANWGWTNPVTLAGSPYTWNLWAGAGQCNTSKGTLVGNVTVVRTAGGYITVTYNMASGYLLKETHVYAGCDQFPKVKQGKKLVSTVAPGQYYNASPVNCTTAYVIAHAVVGIPDPNFGP